MAAVVAAVEAGVVAVASGRGCSSRLVRGLYWRLRAVLRRLRSERARRGRRFSFHYDALSYALNFDDGRAAPAPAPAAAAAAADLVLAPSDNDALR